MCAMNPRLLRPKAGGHPEALAWASRVVAEGGSVGTSLPAVSEFCRSIDAAGIRSKIWRLNLFCGGPSGTVSGLNACLVPLYRGPSPTGTQYGFSIDDNQGPFDTGDYAERGTNGGLKGNGSTKHLNTGFEQSLISLHDVHLSTSFKELETSFDAERTLLGTITSVQGDFCVLRQAITSGNRQFFAATFTVSASAAGSSSESHVLGVRSSNIFTALYRSGSEVNTNTGTAATVVATSTPYFVFARNNNGTADTRTAARMRMYSIGQAIDETGAAAFANAVAAFNLSLGRT